MTIPFRWPVQSMDLAISPVGAHVRNAVLTTAVTITRPEAAKRLLVTIEGQPVRIRFDGGAATATTGILFAASETYAIDIDASVTSISVIETAVGGIINYQWVA